MAAAEADHPNDDAWIEAAIEGGVLDAADREAARRRTLTIAFALVAWGSGMLSSIVHASNGAQGRAIFAGLYGMVFVVCLVGLRVGRRRPEPVANMILVLAALGLVTSPLLSEGSEAVPIGLVTLPAAAVLSMGYRSGWYWIPISVGLIALMASNVPDSISDRTLLWNTAIVAAMLGIASCWIDVMRVKATDEAVRANQVAIREVESRLRMEVSLAEREVMLARVVQRSPSVLVLSKVATGEIVEVNDRFVTLSGWSREETIGRTLTDLGAWPSLEERDRLRDVVLKGNAQGSIETRLLDAAGEPLDLLASVEVVSFGDEAHLLVQALDVTERKRFQDQVWQRARDQIERQGAELEESRDRLHRQEQLASIGTLAAGIAHQINNPVGGIRMIAELSLGDIERKPDDARALSEAFGRILEEAARCGEIVRSILQFSRSEPMSRWSGELNEALADAIRLVRPRMAAKGAKIRMHLCESPLVVLLNPIAIHQILTNLMENASQASDGPVSIDVETSVRRGQAIVTIRDDGRGISSDAVAQAFEPFYTTRLDEGGTGLGLSVVHGLVTELGGTIDLRSELGAGLEVEIALPLHEG